MQKTPRMLHDSLGAFSKSLKKSGGKLIVVVHPFYRESLLSPYDFTSGVTKAGYHKKLGALWAKAKPPIIVLEESENLAKTHGKILEANPSANVFFVRTVENRSTPKNGWKKFSNLLKESKVKTILLAGRNSYASRDEYPEEIMRKKIISEYEKTKIKNKTILKKRKTISNACVGYAYAMLVERGHNVFLLNKMLYPEQP